MIWKLSLSPRGWVNSPLFHVSREFCFVKLICRNLDALFSHVRNAYIANQNGVQLSFDMEVWSVFTHMASIYANLLEQIKRKHLHKKTVQLPEDWFGTPTWPPFHCFWTPVWPPWRHVKTLCNQSTTTGVFFAWACSTAEQAMCMEAHHRVCLHQNGASQSYHRDYFARWSWRMCSWFNKMCSLQKKL